jgi:hypothetical protein
MEPAVAQVLGTASIHDTAGGRRRCPIDSAARAESRHLTCASSSPLGEFHRGVMRPIVSGVTKGGWDTWSSDLRQTRRAISCHKR